jgi:hypothetical protein
MRIRNIIIIISLVMWLMVGNPQPSQAQTSPGPTGFKNVTLWLYPEYDNPRFLVMLEGQITGTQPPTPIRFLVPHAAELFSAGSKDAQGTYTGGPPNRASSQIPGWDEISYELKYPTFRVEYYDSISVGNPDKKVSYDFRSLFPISDLKVVVQQPLTATNFAVVPSGTPSKEDNFNVLTYSFSNPDINQPLHFEISYVKTDPDPSLSNTPPTSASSNSAGQLALILTLAVIVVAVAAFIVINRTKKRKPVKVKAAEVQPGLIGKRGLPVDKYCNQCGKPLGKRYKFCPHCGNTIEKS